LFHTVGGTMVKRCMSKARKDSKRFDDNGFTFWECSGCAYSKHCYVYDERMFKVVHQCELFEYVDERGVICPGPPALRFILED
jgi:hypothetical protein